LNIIVYANKLGVLLKHAFIDTHISDVQ